MEWAVVDRTSGLLAGRRALKRIDWDDGSADAAGYVAAAFRGRRFASRSLRLAAAHALESWGIRRIRADCDLDNLASYRSMLRAGMTYTGLLREQRGGHLVDVHAFGLSASELKPAVSLVSI
jgi:RimJ/RimL family protein N-acetyltransferase